MSETRDVILGLTAQIVSSHVVKNTVEPDRLPELIREVYRTLASMEGEPSEGSRPKPVVALSRSVFPDHVVCVECGKKMKMLKRHLMTDHKMTPDQYRTRWGLPANYPMVAANYAKIRSTLAKQIGLGQKRIVGRRGGRKRG
jgi:predicted transcriptional regulator